MSYIRLDDLLKTTESVYKLVILASKRALELNDGQPKLVEVSSEKLSTVALEEIAQGKVTYKTKVGKDKKSKAE